MRRYLAGLDVLGVPGSDVPFGPMTEEESKNLAALQKGQATVDAAAKKVNDDNAKNLADIQKGQAAVDAVAKAALKPTTAAAPTPAPATKKAATPSAPAPAPGAPEKPSFLNTPVLGLKLWQVGLAGFGAVSLLGGVTWLVVARR